MTLRSLSAITKCSFATVRSQQATTSKQYLMGSLPTLHHFTTRGTHDYIDITATRHHGARSKPSFSRPILQRFTCRPWGGSYQSRKLKKRRYHTVMASFRRGPQPVL